MERGYYTTISGVKYRDLNSNGVKDPGEPGLAGWTIYMDANDNGQLDNNEQRVVVGETGQYEFHDLLPGSYLIREVPMVGWIPTGPVPRPTMTVESPPIAEGTGGVTEARFTLRLSNAFTQPVTIDYATQDDLAVAGSDYTAASGTVTFAPGETEKIVSVFVTADSLNESNERFFLLFSNPVNMQQFDGRVERVILNDDATFIVNSTLDKIDLNPGDGIVDTGTPGEVTLRAAIMEANATPGTATILLQPGLYQLSRPGRDEDAGLTGDLDVTDDLIVTGAGPTLTSIDAHQLDRVFHASASAHLSLSGRLDQTIRKSFLL